MSHVILNLSDALRYDAAVAGMGYLEHLVVSNYGVRLSNRPEIFQSRVQAGKATAGALVRKFSPKIAPTICKLMGITIPDSIRAAPIL